MQPRPMVPPKGESMRLLTKNARNLLEVTLYHRAGSFQIFWGALRSPTGQMLPVPLQKLAIAEHADGTWLCLPLSRPVINSDGALAEVRMFAKHLDS